MTVALFTKRHDMMQYLRDLPPQTKVFAAFFIYSFGLGGLYPRMGDIQLQMGVAEGALGLSLIGAAVGTMISLTFAGPLIERAGHRRTLFVLVPAMSVFMALASFAATPAMLFLALVPAGLCIGAVEQVINVEADRVEYQIGRRLMSRAHAFWSFGFFGAGLFGALAKQIGISPQVHLLIVIPLVTGGMWLFLSGFQQAPLRAGTRVEAAPRLARPTLGILVLVAMTLSAVMLEGAGADWSAIFMRNEFAVAPFLAGFAVAIGALAQATTRYFADRFVERHSPIVVARTLLGILGVGATLVSFAPHPYVALAGFALMGVGTSAIFPLAMSAAAQRTDRPSVSNVAALAQLSFVAFLLGPPLLGFVAEHLGIRWSFGLCLPLVAVSFAAAAGLRPALGKAAPAHG